MSALAFILSFAPVALFAYFLWDFAREFSHAPGEVWDRILAAGKGSATLAWSRLIAMIGLAAGGMASVGDYLGAPGVADAIRAAIADHPNWVLAFGIIVPLVTEWARRRTL